DRLRSGSTRARPFADGVAPSISRIAALPLRLRYHAPRGHAQVFQGVVGSQLSNRIEEIGIAMQNVMVGSVGQSAKTGRADVFGIAMVHDDRAGDGGKFLRVEKMQTGGAQRSQARRLAFVLQQLLKQIL